MQTAYLAPVACIQTQYLQGIRPAIIEWPKETSLEFQEQVLEATVRAKTPNKAHFITESYSTKFLKGFQLHVENTMENELLEDIILDYVDLLTKSKTGFVPSLPNNEESILFKAYPMGYDPESMKIQYLVIEEDQLQISQGTTGLVVWPAALRLFDYMNQNPSLVEGKTLLELGSGVGLCSIACRYLGAKSIIATDIDENVLARLKRNMENTSKTIEIPTDSVTKIHQITYTKPSTYTELILQPLTNSKQKAQGQFKTLKLDWETVKQEEIDEINAQIILCADVIYSPELIPYLVATLKKCLNRKSTDNNKPIAILSATIRQETTLLLFLDVCKENNVLVELLQESSKERPAASQFWVPQESTIRLLKLYMA